MNWFNNRKVGVKISLICAVFMIIICVISMQGIITMKRAGADFMTFYEDRFIPVRQLNRILANLLQIRINMGEQLSHAERNEWDVVEKRSLESKRNRDEYMKDWKDFMATTLTAGESRLAKEWIALSEAPLKLRSDFESTLMKKKLLEAENIMDRWTDEYGKLKDQTKKLIDLLQSLGAQLKEDQEKQAANVFVMSLVILGISLAFGVVMTLVLARSISGPLLRGVAFARKFAAGDLTARIDLSQTDELGELAKALNSAGENLEGLVSGVVLASQNLAQAVEQISSGNQNLSQRTSEQASSLEEIASTIEETTATARQNSENSNEANRLAEISSRLAEEGGRLSGEAVKGINEISDVSKKISDITTVINEISFQTNLLALNAAVEAARAGEAGRGFAVVAGEIRNLAQRSGNAAREIGSLISETIAKIESGSTLVIQSGNSLKNIIESIRKVNRIVSEIYAASSEQKQGMDQINVAVTEMDNMTQQNAALVEETASASEEMANQSQELLRMMEKFTLKRIDAGTKRPGEIGLKGLSRETGRGPENHNGRKSAGTEISHPVAGSAGRGGSGNGKASVKGKGEAGLLEEGFEMF